MIIWSVFLLNIFEWYDYALYIVFQDIISTNFLSGKDEIWILFALGYLTRALGGVYFSIIARNNSNVYSIGIASNLMLLCTLCIGFLPSKTTYVYYIIHVLRMIQGFALGGIMSLSIITLIDYANDSAWYTSRGFLASLPIASVPLGLILGNAIRDVIYMYYGDFSYWWRIPFLISGVGCFFSAYLFISSKRISGMDIKEADITFTLYALYTSSLSILASICIAGINGVGFYFITSCLIPIFFKDVIYYLYILISIMVLLGGFISGIYKNIIYFILITILFSFLGLIKGYEIMSDLLFISSSIIFISSVGMYIGAEGLMHALLYKSIYSQIAFAFAYNLAMFIFGGTAPAIVLHLMHSNQIYLLTCYFIGVFFIALLGLYIRDYILYKKRDASC